MGRNLAASRQWYLKLPRYITSRCTLIITTSAQIVFLILAFFLFWGTPPTELLVLHRRSLSTIGSSGHSRSSEGSFSSSKPVICAGVQLVDVETAFLPTSLRGRNLTLPPQNDMSKFLQQMNALPPRNQHLFPQLPSDHLIFVLSVHNQPAYLRTVVDSLSRVDGIREALLIVSHDGFYQEINAIIDGISFCQVKQIFAPFSPHIYAQSFPGESPGDCHGRDDPQAQHCNGNTDQNGNHREAAMVSSKHHWWWMMNTVWDGLSETKDYKGHMIFIEEDLYIFPNAYRNIQILCALKACACPDCCAATLGSATSAVQAQPQTHNHLVAERIGIDGVGYAFNRTIWRKIHASAERFCGFDDRRWGETMAMAVYPAWGEAVYALRGPRASARRLGKCSHGSGRPCEEEEEQVPIVVEEEDTVPNIIFKASAESGAVPVHDLQDNPPSQAHGGWGDTRDHNLCLDFASLYVHSDVV